MQIEAKYLSEREVAARLGLSTKWLQKMRRQNCGIPFCKFGGAVRYPIDEVLAYESQALSQTDPVPTPDAAQLCIPSPSREGDILGNKGINSSSHDGRGA
jgi:hypothetical protein